MHEYSPDEPDIAIGCPDWCRNACVAACPTRALKGGGKIDPRRCISFLTYYGEGLTPLELREPMGMYVYGCDRCQNVCPRNIPWMAGEKPQNPRVSAKAANFDLCLPAAYGQAIFRDRKSGRTCSICPLMISGAGR